MATAEALLVWARSQIGTVEKPPGSNNVRYWDDIRMHNFQGQPWCAAFVLAGLEQIGVGPVTHSVYVPQIRSEYRVAHRLYPIAEAQPGDQVLFKFGPSPAETHTGIVESVDRHAHTVTSIDGNTSSALGGNEVNGGGVYRRIRPWSLTWGVGRPQFDPAHPPSQPIVNFPGDHMQRIPVSDPTNPLGAAGTGFWDLDGGHPGRPRVAFSSLVASPFVNGADGFPANDKGHNVEPYDHGGNVRLRMWGFEPGAVPLIFVPVGT